MTKADTRWCLVLQAGVRARGEGTLYLHFKEVVSKCLRAEGLGWASPLVLRVQEASHAVRRNGIGDPRSEAESSGYGVSPHSEMSHQGLVSERYSQVIEQSLFVNSTEEGVA